MTTSTPRNFLDLKLFTGRRQYDSFWRASQLFATTTMSPSTDPCDWPDGGRIELPGFFQHDGQMKASEDLLATTDTVALLVLHDGAVAYERYALTGGRSVQWTSWSMAKSFVSTLVGIALEEGLIGSLDEAISDYVPVQPGSAYDGVSIRDALRMCSGARWVEDYTDENAEYRDLLVTRDTGEFIARMTRASEPGSAFYYNSADTQALGVLLKSATGRTVTEYMQEKLYEPLGLVTKGYWVLDAAGTELVYGGLNMTARDYAKLGELFRLRGSFTKRVMTT